MLTRIKYHDLLQQLDEAANWLSKVQINISGSRFKEIHSNVEQITAKYESGDIDALIEAKGNEELWLSLSECDAFIRIYSALKNTDSSMLPRQALKHMIGGPLLPRHESPNTAHSRNILFELELAARFKEVGIDVIGYDDIQLYLSGNNIGIQCKRPYSKKNVRENLRVANKQIQKRYSATKQAIIAFAIDKIYETDRSILVVNNQNEIPYHVTKGLRTIKHPA